MTTDVAEAPVPAAQRGEFMHRVEFVDTSPAECAVHVTDRVLIDGRDISHILPSPGDYRSPLSVVPWELERGPIGEVIVVLRPLGAHVLYELPGDAPARVALRLSRDGPLIDLLCPAPGPRSPLVHYEYVDLDTPGPRPPAVQLARVRFFAAEVVFRQAIRAEARP